MDCLTNYYNRVNNTQHDSQCPLLEKCINLKDRSPWFHGEILSRKKRCKEHKWCNEGSDKAWDEYKNVRNHYNELLNKS